MYIRIAFTSGAGLIYRLLHDIINCLFNIDGTQSLQWITISPVSRFRPVLTPRISCFVPQIFKYRHSSSDLNVMAYEILFEPLAWVARSILLWPSAVL